MVEARSVALVGASERSGSFGARMLAEMGKSAARPTIYPVNPRYAEIDGRRCYPSLADLPGPVDLVLLGVPDAALEGQLALAADQGCRSAVIFGNANEDRAHEDRAHEDQAHEDRAHEPALRRRLASIARSAGMELCGAGCMGFANVGYGLRAMGYIEPDPLPAGPVALVTHSGSVFSALLRTRRSFGFTLAVSSGQELVTAAPSFLSYALDQPETKVLALVLEAIRQPAGLRGALRIAAERGIPVVLLTAGNSASGKAMVAAHSGALAGSDGAWEALCRGYGLHRVFDLAELADTLELFCAQARPGRPALLRPGPGRGIATVHDSGLERAHAADVADEADVPYAVIGEATRIRLTELLDPGLLPTNPLDVWGTGAGTRELFGGCLAALAQDESVQAVALAVDLVTELDGDDAYQLAMLDVASRTDKPLVVVANLPSAIDPDAAAWLRGSGIPVLEGMRTGMRALRHLLDHAAGPGRLGPLPPDELTGAARPTGRLTRARKLLREGQRTGAAQLALLREYGIRAAHAKRARSPAEAAAAASRTGYPVVLKTDEPTIAHKSDAQGVVLGIADEAALLAAYADLASRLGPAVLVCEQVPGGVELALGVVRDPALGPLLVVGAGGILVELIADRAVALPPVTSEQAAALLGELKVGALLRGVRGAQPADLAAVAEAMVRLSELAIELGNEVSAIDVNPLICGPHGAIAADALVVRVP